MTGRKKDLEMRDQWKTHAVVEEETEQAGCKRVGG